MQHMKKDPIKELSGHCGVDKPDKTFEGEDCMLRPALISTDVSTE